MFEPIFYFRNSLEFNAFFLLLIECFTLVIFLSFSHCVLLLQSLHLRNLRCLSFSRLISMNCLSLFFSLFALRKPLAQSTLGIHDVLPSLGVIPVFCSSVWCIEYNWEVNLESLIRLIAQWNYICFHPFYLFKSTQIGADIVNLSTGELMI